MLELRNYQQQIIHYFNNVDEREWNIENIRKELVDKLDFFDFMEICIYLRNTGKIYILQNFTNNDLHQICDKNIEAISIAEQSLNASEYLAYLIGYRRKLNPFEIYNISYFTDVIDNKIIIAKAILNDIYYDDFSISELYGLFFIYPKNIAISKFKNYVTKLYKIRKTDDIFFRLNTNFHKFFINLNSNFIPLVTKENYKTITKLDSENFVTKNELLQIIRDKEYFLKEFPLQNIDKKYLLKSENYNDEELIKYLIHEFFNEILGYKNEYNNTTISEIFLSNISDNIPKFDRFQLMHAKKILTKYISEDYGKDKFLSLFSYLFSFDGLSNISNTLPVLFEEYFEFNNILKSRVRDSLIKPDNWSKNFKEVYNETFNYLSPLKKQFIENQNIKS